MSSENKIHCDVGLPVFCDLKVNDLQEYERAALITKVTTKYIASTMVTQPFGTYLRYTGEIHYRSSPYLVYLTLVPIN